jgi:hypothetical protein
MNELISGRKNGENDAMSAAPAGGRAGRKGSKGFVFAVDAMLSLLLLAAFAASIAYFSSQLSASNVPLIDQQRKAGDMLVLLDKLQMLNSQNATVIEQAINQTMMPSLSWNLTVEYYNYTITQWADNSSDICRDINITNAGASTLTSFPAYINLTYDPDMQPNYIDLRFYSAPCNNGGALLAYEIENYTAANAHIWVNVPILPPGNTTISVYYKNSTAVGSGQNASGVWDNDYVMVLHLDEPGTGTRYDSTKYGNNGTPTNYDGNEKIAGMIDGSDDLDGASTAGDYLQTTSDQSQTADNITWELWFNSYNTSYARHMIWEGDVAGNGWGAQQEMHISMGLFNTSGINDQLSFYLGAAEPQTTSAGIVINTSFTDTADFHYVVGTAYNLATSPEGQLFLDGTVVGTDTGTTAGTPRTGWNTDLRIGRPGTNNRYFDGVIDEVRVSNVTRSADWLNQSYQMVANQGSYVGFGSEESKADSVTIVTFVIDNNITLGTNDTDASAVSAADRIFVVKNDSTGMIDRYGRARLKTWAQ